MTWPAGFAPGSAWPPGGGRRLLRALRADPRGRPDGRGRGLQPRHGAAGADCLSVSSAYIMYIICVYIYIYREREIEREKDGKKDRDIGIYLWPAYIHTDTCTRWMDRRIDKWIDGQKVRWIHG